MPIEVAYEEGDAGNRDRSLESGQDALNQLAERRPHEHDPARIGSPDAVVEDRQPIEIFVVSGLTQMRRARRLAAKAARRCKLQRRQVDPLHSQGSAAEMRANVRRIGLAVQPGFY